MQPIAIALNYSIKNIQNDVRQKGIIIYIYEKKKAIEHTKCGACSRLPKQQMSVGLRNQYTGFLCPKEGGGGKMGLYGLLGGKYVSMCKACGKLGGSGDMLPL